MIERSGGSMKDLISRQALCEYALNQKDKSITPNDIMRFPSAQPEQTNSWCINSWCIGCKEYDQERHCCPRWNRVIRQTLKDAQPERLTDDDFETIRIHLNAYKEKLCNQQRWEEADEYQRILDRFMAFASAQPETHEERTETHTCDCIERQAVWHLDWFTKLYCRDKSITDDLVFRCEQCKFETPDAKCLVKVMARKLCPDYKDFGAMGDL